MNKWKINQRRLKQDIIIKRKLGKNEMMEDEKHAIKFSRSKWQEQRGLLICEEIVSIFQHSPRERKLFKKQVKANRKTWNQNSFNGLPFLKSSVSRNFALKASWIIFPLKLPFSPYLLFIEAPNFSKKLPNLFIFFKFLKCTG